MKKVKFDTRLEHEYLQNWKLLQGSFKKVGIEKVINYSTKGGLTPFLALFMVILACPKISNVEKISVWRYLVRKSNIHAGFLLRRSPKTLLRSKKFQQD